MKRVFVWIMAWSLLFCSFVPVLGANPEPKFDKEDYLYATAVLEPNFEEEKKEGIVEPLFRVEIGSQDAAQTVFYIQYSSTTFDGEWYTNTYAYAQLPSEKLDFGRKLERAFSLDLDGLNMFEMVYRFQVDEDLNETASEMTEQEVPYDIHLVWTGTNEVNTFVNNHFSWGWDKSLVYKEKSNHMYALVSGTINDVSMDGAIGEYGRLQQKVPVLYMEESSPKTLPENNGKIADPKVTANAPKIENANRPIKMDHAYVSGNWMLPGTDELDMGSSIHFSINKNPKPSLGSTIYMTEELYDENGHRIASKTFIGDLSDKTVAWPKGETADILFDQMITGRVEIYYEDDTLETIDGITHEIRFSFHGTIDQYNRGIAKYADDFSSSHEIQRTAYYSGLATLELNGVDYGSTDAMLDEWYMMLSYKGIE